MNISTSKGLLLLLFSSAVSVSAFAAETLHTESPNVIDADHAYETVVPEDDKKEGIELGDGWKVTGDLRMGYVDYDYSNSPQPVLYNPDINKGHQNSRGFYVIPKVSITTPTYNGFSAKITGAGVTDFGINNSLYESRTFAFGASGDPYAILQEAYIQYVNGGHAFMVGAKEIVTPMVDADDWYLFANTFQGAYYKNTIFENITFAGGYIYKMAGVWDSGADGANYHSIADTSYLDQRDKDKAGDSGMWAGVFQYSDDTHDIQLWDYYAVDLYNTFFSQYDYTSKYNEISYDAGIQFIDFQDVGSNRFTPIDYNIFSLKFDAKFNNGFDLSTGVAFYSDGPGAGATLGAWGGYPYFANGMIFHFFEAGDMRNTNSYKAQFGYDFGEQGLNGLWIGARYSYFDLDPKYSKSSKNGLGQDAQKNYGLRVSYNDDSGFYFTGTYEYVDLDHQNRIDALRLIGGYKF